MWYGRVRSKGKKRGISIIMDPVVNHCSSHHEWPKKACDGPVHGLLLFLPSKDKEPNNWESYWGSVWGAGSWYQQILSPILSTRISLDSPSAKTPSAKRFSKMIIGGWTRELRASGRCHYQHQKGFRMAFASVWSWQWPGPSSESLVKCLQPDWTISSCKKLKSVLLPSTMPSL